MTDNEREALKQELCDRCGWAISGHVSSTYGLDCPMSPRPGFRRSEAPEPSAEMIERLRDQIDEARDAVTTHQHSEPTWEPSALDAVKEWVSEKGDFTAVAEPAYIKGFEDAQEIVRGLIQAHTELAAGGVR